MSKKQKPLYFRLVSDEVRDNCVKALFVAQQNSNEVLEVTIQPEQRKRSLSQNRLYHLWVAHFSEHTGMSIDATYFEFKRRFLLRIYYTADSQFAEMCDSIKQLEQLDLAKYQSISKQVIAMTSTTKASTEQMTEYLNQINRFAYSQNIMLPIPDDLKYALEDNV